MKKIGILTFHDALNFGAVLQSYALQSFIAGQGDSDVEIIDYRSPLEQRFTIPRYASPNPVKRLIAYGLNLYYSHSLKKRNNRFEDFAARCQNLSKRVYACLEDFEKYCDYDILVAGSDQVFNPKQDSQIYYLGFESPHSKRIAYAPSFGISSLPDDKRAMITPWVRNFDALSCRETAGAEILKEITGEDVPVVSDPIFLVNREDWKKLAVSPDYSDYIFVFDLNGGEDLFAVARKLSKQTGLPIVYSSLKTIHPYVRGCRTRHDLGPKEWIGHISKASYVVTDSFHGTMFGLHLNTPVIGKIAKQSTSSRLTTMMSKLNIEDQLFARSDDFDLKKIRFGSYQDALDEYIDQSKRYLISALKSVFEFKPN